MDRQPVALVVGAGDATGGAVARRFAAEGFQAVATRRHGDRLAPLVDGIRAKGGVAHGFGVDARDEAQTVAFLERVEREIGPIVVAVYNVGGNVRFPLVETTARVYRKVWEMAAFGAFLLGREAARHMLPRQRGTILFTGATASVRGGSGFAAFAGAKHAKRALAQSMARELGPKGIHVAHVVIDGMIDTAFTRENRAEALAARPWEPNRLDPDHIAEAYWQLHRQPPSAWSFELDLRPWAEPW